MSAKTLSLSIRNRSFCHIGLIAIAIAACLASQGCSPWRSLKLDPDTINAYEQSPGKTPYIYLSGFLSLPGQWRRQADVAQGIVVDLVATQEHLITLKYSDEVQQRTIWKYYDYSRIRQFRVSDDGQLFFVIEETSPFKSRSLYIYDLKARKRIGRIKIDLNKIPEKDIPF